MITQNAVVTERMRIARKCATGHHDELRRYFQAHHQNTRWHYPEILFPESVPMTSDTDQKSSAGSDEIEVTPEMIKAGAVALLTSGDQELRALGYIRHHSFRSAFCAPL